MKRFTCRTLRLCVIACLASCYSVSSGNGEMIPFVLPWDDNSSNITNLSETLDQHQGIQHRITTNPDGQFVKGNERIRFYGVNIGAAAAFPDQELAGPIARRMAKFGLNVARFHHVDNGWTESLIDYGSGGSIAINTENLDRMDRFIAELKKAGIYTNFNLLCSRVFKEADGLHPGVDQLDWKTTHILGMFDEGARNLQKQFASDFLNHLNPYTGLTYLEDPAIAIVEINNETGLVHMWHSGNLDTLPSFYSNSLQNQWNEWLKAKYESTESMITRWGFVDEPLSNNLLSAQNAENWNLEQHDSASASQTTTTRSTAIEVNKIGSASWHVQYHHGGVSIEKGQIYTIQFSIRASHSRNISVSMMQAYNPWQNLGFSKLVAATPEWQDVEYTFIPGVTDANARINFGNMGSQTGTIEIRDVSFRKGGKQGVLEAGQNLELSSIPLIDSGSRGFENKMKDWFQFLLDTEKAYWQDMYDYIQRLGYQGIVWGTTVMNSTPHLQATMDAIDSHAYWQHPHFLQSSWDPENWTVGNEAMVNDTLGGVIPELAWQRVRGYAHNVTEYQHCAPNPYESEGPLFAAIYGSLQDWDGIYLFHYGAGNDDWNRGQFTGFFDVDQHPTKMINTAIASLAFRRFDIRSAEKVLNIPFSEETNLDLVTHKGGAWAVGDARHLELDARIPLIHRVQMDLTPDTRIPDTHQIELDSIALPETEYAPITSDTTEIVWEHDLPGKSTLVVNCDRVKIVSGFQNGKIRAWPGLHMQCYNTTNDWCNMSVILTTGDSFQGLRQSGGSGIIATTGQCENTNMGWKNAEKTSVGSDWGSAPTLVERVSGFVVFEVDPSQLTVWSLDEKGNRKAALSVEVHQLGAIVQLGGTNGAPWYEFQVSAP